MWQVYARPLEPETLNVALDAQRGHVDLVIFLRRSVAQRTGCTHLFDLVYLTFELLVLLAILGRIALDGDRRHVSLGLGPTRCAARRSGCATRLTRSCHERLRDRLMRWDGEAGCGITCRHHVSRALFEASIWCTSA